MFEEEVIGGEVVDVTGDDDDVSTSLLRSA